MGPEALTRSLVRLRGNNSSSCCVGNKWPLCPPAPPPPPTRWETRFSPPCCRIGCRTWNIRLRHNYFHPSWIYSALFRVCFRSRHNPGGGRRRLLLAAWVWVGIGHHRGPRLRNLHRCRNCRDAGEAVASVGGKYFRCCRASQAVGDKGVSASGGYLSSASWWVRGHPEHPPGRSRLDRQPRPSRGSQPAREHRRLWGFITPTSVLASASSL